MGTSPHSPNQVFNNGTMQVLTGWKEISTYLRSGVRTVQRWETIGLPVRRIGVGPRSPVIAFAQELDAWEKAAPTRFSDVIDDLKMRVYSLEMELASLKQQLNNERQRNSLRNQTETRHRVTASRSSARPLLRSEIQ